MCVGYLTVKTKQLENFLPNSIKRTREIFLYPFTDLFLCGFRVIDFLNLLYTDQYDTKFSYREAPSGLLTTKEILNTQFFVIFLNPFRNFLKNKFGLGLG
jgi:hypothetical protein